MNRREFIALLGGAAAARAQQPAMPVVGVTKASMFASQKTPDARGT